jgi:hypothetical protein
MLRLLSLIKMAGICNDSRVLVVSASAPDEGMIPGKDCAQRASGGVAPRSRWIHGVVFLCLEYRGCGSRLHLDTGPKILVDCGILFRGMGRVLGRLKTWRRMHSFLELPSGKSDTQPVPPSAFVPDLSAESIHVLTPEAGLGCLSRILL